MSTKNIIESHMSHQLHQALKVVGKEYHQPFVYTRLESNMTSQGIFDTIMCVGGMELWIEFKVYPNTLSPMQIGFAESRRRAGNRHCYLLTAYKTHIRLQRISESLKIDGSYRIIAEKLLETR